ncbi:MAG TPA: MupG family TIM beta-alpha barrel fold protein [Clostridia bacterium]|nr:MupG family TIM beta-alpha barrel fold protein [Clostridia bacterium]
MVGIALYTGIGYSLPDNLEYLERAAALGIKEVFTSLHIPEADGNVYKEAEEILLKARQLGMTVTADISRNYMDRTDLKAYDLYALRLDFGFTASEIAALSREAPFRIQLNASTISDEYLDVLIHNGAEMNRMEVCHNYYPRRDTGIAYELFMERNRCFMEHGMKIAAFIPLQHERRGPLHEGLPTLECHRDLSPLISSQHLLHSGVDTVYIGDAFATEKELKSIASVKKNIYSIPLRLYEPRDTEIRILSGLHTNRMDPGEYVIRSQEARLKVNERISRRNSIERKKYSVTIDNEGYLRYEGELQILKKELQADERVNVAGDASEAGLLIEMVKPGDCFEFIMSDVWSNV